MTRASILVLLCLTTFAWADTLTTVYKRKLPDGSVSYSDQASDQAEVMEVQPVPTVPALKADLPATKQKPAEAKDPYEVLSIASPAHDTAFYSGNGNVNVSVSISPALKRGHQIQLSLDGKVIGTQASTGFMIPNVDRGTHQLKLDVLNRKGQPVQSAQSTFTVHRPIIKR